jgi:hypothetical protein
MGIYKNDYKRNEDECLWEIHEIRNDLHKEIKKESYDEINNKARLLFNKIKGKHQEKVLVKR